MIKYMSRELSIKSFYDTKNIIRMNDIFIVVYDENNNNVFIPSVFNGFLITKYKNSSLNTKLKIAKDICMFLNYLLIKVSEEDDDFVCLKDEGIAALNFNHLASFITYSTKIKNNKFNTVKEKKKHILRFYEFLSKRKLIRENTETTERHYFDDRGREIISYTLSRFELSDDYNVTYPLKLKRKNNIKKDLDEDTFDLFIEFAEKEVPEIVFGIEIDCCGGLREGENVNLSLSDITLNKNRGLMLLNIEDRSEVFYKDRNINTNNSQVKKPRENQPVFDFNKQLFELYEKHLRIRKTLLKCETDALFINADGKPMSGDSYSKAFNKLKKKFILYLEDNGFNQLAKELSMKDWLTHLGRHIFTNYLIKKHLIDDVNGIPDRNYLRILRGDSSPETAGEYIDITVLIENVGEKLNLLSKISTKKG